MTARDRRGLCYLMVCHNVFLSAHNYSNPVFDGEHSDRVFDCEHGNPVFDGEHCDPVFDGELSKTLCSMVNFLP